MSSPWERVKLSKRFGAFQTKDMTRDSMPAAKSQASTNAQHPMRRLETMSTFVVLLDVYGELWKRKIWNSEVKGAEAT